MIFTFSILHVLLNHIFNFFIFCVSLISYYWSWFCVSNSFLPILLWAPFICHTFASTVPSKQFLFSLTSMLLNPGATSQSFEALDLIPDVLFHPATSSLHSSWFSCIFACYPISGCFTFSASHPYLWKAFPLQSALTPLVNPCCFIAPKTTHGLMIPNLYLQLICLSWFPDAWI